MTGAGPGDTTSGTGVILAFEHAYFVARDAAAARTLLTPDTTLPSAEIMQRGIDHTPPGTRYCATITPDTGPVSAGHHRWHLALTIQYPDQAPDILYQHITTRDHDSRTLITTISAAAAPR